MGGVLRGGAVVMCAYALGCLSTGYYVTRLWAGRDVREAGSGSAGARNVGRLLGWKGFVLTFLGDAAKGALAVCLALAAGVGPWPRAAVLPAVVAGHVWPAPLRFRGGKGMSTALGAVLVFDWRVAVGGLAAAALVWVLTRRTVVAGVAGIALLPVAGWGIGSGAPSILGLAGLAGLVLHAHTPNLRAECGRMTAAARRRAGASEGG